MYLLFIHYKHAMTQKLWVLVIWEPDYGKSQFRLVAILKNGRHFENKLNFSWHHIQKSSLEHQLTLYQISCFYHKMHNSTQNMHIST